MAKKPAKKQPRAPKRSPEPAEAEPTQTAPDELAVPEEVRTAASAVELLRAWIADGGLHLILRPDAFSHNISEWGRLLGDTAHHVARAIALDGQVSEAEALRAIREALDLALGEAGRTERRGAIKGRTRH